MAGRFFRRTPVAALKLTWAFVTRNFESDLDSLRETFFSQDVALQDLQEYVLPYFLPPKCAWRRLSY